MMEYFIWFSNNLLLPIAGLFYPLLDFLLRWIYYLPPAAAIVVCGIITGLGMNIFLKFYGNQEFLGKAKSDLAKIKLLQAQAKEKSDKDTTDRLNRLTGRISGTYAWEALKPSLFTIIPICIFALWMGSRFAYLPLQPGQTVKIKARFEDGAAGLAHIIPNNYIGASAPIALIFIPDEQASSSSFSLATGVQANWKINLLNEGIAPLVIRYNDKTYRIGLSVQNRGAIPPDPVMVLDRPTPDKNGLLSLEFELPDSIAAAWWNLHLKWVGLYLVMAIICGVGFRYILGIN